MNRAFQEAMPYLANPDQLCYARLSRLEEGTGRGQRIVDVNNGSGLAFTVTPDRGMNLVECTFAGVPAAFRTPSGHRGCSGDFLRDWTGGLMTTSGLCNAGSPAGDQPLHGMISRESAVSLCCSCKDGDVLIAGQLREGALFGCNLVLDREIRTAYGCNGIDIRDTVTNRGEASQFTEILYHCNLGYPLVSPATRFEVPEHAIEPRDEAASRALNEWDKFPAPLSGFSEHCFRHTLAADGENMACMRIVNADARIALNVRYDVSTLPQIVQWRKPSRNAYVLGLEPTNASLNGYEYDRANGYGKTLQPGESISYHVILEFQKL